MDHRGKVREGCVDCPGQSQSVRRPYCVCTPEHTHPSSSHWLSFLWCVCRTSLKIQDKNNTKPPSPVTPSGLFQQKNTWFCCNNQNAILYSYKEPCALHSMQVSLLDIISPVDKLSCSVMGW